MSSFFYTDFTAIYNKLISATGGDTPDNPVPLPVSLDLAGGGWAALLTTLQSAGKYVALDLSICTMSGTEFDPQPGPGDAGEGRIVSLVLPNTAESITAGSVLNPTFQYFSSLKSVTGTNITDVGGYTFRLCPALRTANFSTAQSIGLQAFFGCTALTTVDLSMVEIIEGDAFSGCTHLTMVSLPEAATIQYFAFNNCTALATVNIPAAETIQSSAFANCTGLTSITLPASLTSIVTNPFPGCTSLTGITVDDNNPSYKADGGKLLSKDGAVLIGWPAATGDVTLDGVINIDPWAFYGCTALIKVSLPEAQIIGNNAFYGCTSLETVSLPEVTSFKDRVFSHTGTTALTVTLGDTPPKLESQMFYNVPNTAAGESGGKSVTVKVPGTALASYGSSPSNTTDDTWGNGFRGGGWQDDSMMFSNSVNANITLNIEALP
jgi:hypothetical protein